MKKESQKLFKAEQTESAGFARFRAKTTALIGRSVDEKLLISFHSENAGRFRISPA